MKTYGSVPNNAKYRVVSVEYETVGLVRSVRGEI
jgi:hypothetical protein